MDPDPDPSLLARVRWANVARLLALPAAALVVACWPRVSPPEPRLPDASARPVTLPDEPAAARPAPRPTGPARPAHPTRPHRHRHRKPPSRHPPAAPPTAPPVPATGPA